MNIMSRAQNYWNHIKYLIQLNRYHKQELRNGAGNGNGSAVIMFHHVRDDTAIEISDSCKCTKAEFVEFLDYVSANKKVVTFDDVLASASGGNLENKIVITFDDVPDNFFTTAYPILKEHKFPFTLYLTVGFINRPGYLSADQIIELSKDSLCTIGAHTVTHPMLKKRDVDLQYEFSECKRVLEELIKKPVIHFAYPYGTPTAINKRIIKYASKHGGYKSATVTIPGLLTPEISKNRFSIPRIHSRLYMSEYLHL